VQDDNDLEEMLTEYYGKKFPQKTRQPKEDVKIPLPKNTTGLGEILHGNPIFTFKEGVYKLVPQCAEFKMVKEEWVSDDFEIVINKQKYDLEPLATAKDIEAAFAQSLVRKFKIAAVQEFESQLVEMQKARTRHKALEKCVDKDTFEVENVGFIKHGGQYYVYLKLPKFAMKHPTREEYYAFEPCRVGVCVNYQNGKVHVSNNEPVVIDNYSHPFIPSDGPALQTICSPSRRKMSGVDIRGLSDEEAIAKVLRHAQNVIMNGLTVESFHSHGGKDIDDTSYYGTTLKNRLRDRIISREQVVKGGYLITNLHQYTQNRR